MPDLMRRLRVLERLRPKPRPIGPISLENREVIVRMEATVVTAYLGGWNTGDDALEAFERGMLSSTSPYCKPDLAYALMQAEWQRFGGYSQDGPAGRTKRLWEAASEVCREIFGGLDGMIDRYPELDWARQEPVVTPSFMGRIVPARAD